MVLALEDWLDRPSAWVARKAMAQDDGLHIQPLMQTKDNWETCLCEGGSRWAVVHGEYDEYGQPELEYLYCPLTLPRTWGRICYYDWRPGRELTEEQATSWALQEYAMHAHDLFNGPAKETANATLSASDVRGAAQQHIEQLRPARIELNGVDFTEHVNSITIHYTRADLGGFR